MNASSLRRRWQAVPALGPLLSGSAWSFVWQSASKASVLLVTLVGARLLGATDFGVYVSLQAVMLVSVAVWDLGLSPMLTRDLAAGEGSIATTLPRMLAARLRLLLLWLAVFAGGVLVLGLRGGEAAFAAALFAAAGLATGAGLLLDACLQGLLRFRASALTTVAGRLATAAAVGLVALLRPEAALAWMAGAFLIGSVATTLLQIGTVLPLMRGRDRACEGDAERGAASPLTTVATVRRALPFALNGFFTLAYSRLDVVVVSVLAGAAQAGWYAPASRMQDALLLFPMTGVAALTPIAARRYAATRRPEAVRAHLAIAIALCLALTLPPVAVAIVLARPIVELTLGDGFEQTIVPLQILAASMPFVAIAAPATSILVATGRAATTTVLYAVSLVVTTVGLALLAPRWGAEGAAWAVLAREPVIALLGMIAVLAGPRRALREAPVPGAGLTDRTAPIG